LRGVEHPLEKKKGAGSSGRDALGVEGEWKREELTEKHKKRIETRIMLPFP